MDTFFKLCGTLYAVYLGVGKDKITVLCEGLQFL